MGAKVDAKVGLKVGSKVGSKINGLEPLLEPYGTIDLITESNEAIKLDATSTLLVDAKGCTDQDNSDLEAICNRTYP